MREGRLKAHHKVCHSAAHFTTACFVLPHVLYCVTTVNAVICNSAFRSGGSPVACFPLFQRGGSPTPLDGQLGPLVCPAHRALPSSEQPLLPRADAAPAAASAGPPPDASLTLPRTPAEEAAGGFPHTADPNRVKAELCIKGSSYKLLF